GGIGEWRGRVEREGRGGGRRVGAEIALPLELVPIARRSPGETGLKLAPSQHFQGLWIERPGQIPTVLVSARVRVEKQVVVQTHLRWNGMRCRDPVNGALDLASIRGPATARGGIVGTVQFDDLAGSLVLHHRRAGNV